MKERTGLVQIYTGNGKGKTSASLGLAMRAVGQGLKVMVIQFMKGGEYTGEMLFAENFLPQLKIMQFGKSCMREEKQLKLNGFARKCPKGDFVRDEFSCGSCRWCFSYALDEEKQAVLDGLVQARKAIESNEWDVLVLDEINCAVQSSIIAVDEIIKLIEQKPKSLELVLTGRNAPKELIEMADLVSEIREIKHPWAKGIGARKGIEY